MPRRSRSVLNWIYLPESRVQSRQGGRQQLNWRVWSQRRHAARTHSRQFLATLLGMVMLLFMVRLGSVVYFLLADVDATSIVVAAEGIHLPQADGGIEVDRQRRLSSVLIHADGRVKLHDQQLGEEQWESHLSDARWRETALLLIIDREASMEVVLGVIEAARAAGYTEIWFATSQVDAFYL